MAANPKVGAGDDTGGARCVLLVSEDRETLTALSRIYACQGRQVVTATTRSDAERKLDSASTPLLVVDLREVGVPEREWLQRIRSRHPELRVIATTSLAPEQRLGAASKPAFDVLLLKPIAVSRLEEETARLLASLGPGEQESRREQTGTERLGPSGGGEHG